MRTFYRGAMYGFSLLLVTVSDAPAFPVGDLKPVICDFGKQFTSAAQFRIYRLHTDVEEYKYFDKNCDGVIDKAERAAIDAYVKREVEDGADAEYQRYKKYHVAIPVPPQKIPPAPKVGGWNSQFVLRDSFEDISIFNGPKDVKLATGATFSYARDNVAANTVWSAKGVAAYPISWTAPPFEGRPPELVPYVVGFAFAPAVSFQRVTNSNGAIALKNDVNVLSYNAGGELAVGNLIDATTTHYFRARTGAVSNFDNQMRSWNIVGEYQPLTNWSTIPNLGTPNPLGTLPVTYELDAIFRMAYAQKTSDIVKDPLFAQGNSVLRAGPVLALGIMPLQGDFSPVPKWLQKANFTASYSWLDDVKTSRSYSHFMAALGYALDDAGNVGVKLSYEKGKIEETAQDVAITKLGLTAKY